MKTDRSITTDRTESVPAVAHDATSISPQVSKGPQVSPLQIGSLPLATPILQAPIAGFTDLVFRRIVRELGGAD